MLTLVLLQARVIDLTTSCRKYCHRYLRTFSRPARGNNGQFYGVDQSDVDDLLSALLTTYALPETWKGFRKWLAPRAQGIVASNARKRPFDGDPLDPAGALVDRLGEPAWPVWRVALGTGVARDRIYRDVRLRRLRAVRSQNGRRSCIALSQEAIENLRSQLERPDERKALIDILAKHKGMIQTRLRTSLARAPGSEGSFTRGHSQNVSAEIAGAK
jgi:hypothetical protein